MKVSSTANQEEEARIFLHAEITIMSMAKSLVYMFYIPLYKAPS